MCDGSCECGGEREKSTIILPMKLLPPDYRIDSHSYGWEVVDGNGRTDHEWTATLDRITKGYDVVEFRSDL